MTDFENQPKNQETEQPENDGGLYKNLNISVRSLSIAIIVGIALIAGLMFFGSKNGGYTVSYDSRGGSDVQSQVYQYQEELVLPQEPTREGYTFTGWYLDQEAKVPIELPVLVEGSTQYYAGWQEK
ncbi:MAG: InlB B-repeat-containing protein [Erysipelotrichaceae bacterium]|nr:InlB B-repeat-containing protein [Erysipelotrichaceae bacterium]